MKSIIDASLYNVGMVLDFVGGIHTSLHVIASIFVNQAIVGQQFIEVHSVATANHTDDMNDTLAVMNDTNTTFPLFNITLLKQRKKKKKHQV